MLGTSSVVPAGAAVTGTLVIWPGSAVVVASTSSRQPQNLPGVWQVVVGVASTVDVVLLSVVVLSLHPNQPGVLQVDVEVDVVEVVVEAGVVLSRQPHQPGVSQVDVRVRVRVVMEVEGGEDDVVVVSVPLLSYIFH